MSSSTIRGMRRKKTLGDVKVAVVGGPGVGKSALTVRFLTKRYIGEYDHQNETRYKHEVMVDGEPVIFEILDTSSKVGTELVSTETLGWADGFLLVYSITDRQSFNYIKRIKQQITDFRNGLPNHLSVGTSSATTLNLRETANSSPSPIPMLLVANKGDLIHLRQISTEEGFTKYLRKEFKRNNQQSVIWIPGEILAKDLDCSFEEVAASEQVNQVAELFHEICREVQLARRKTKQSLLDRVLGNKAAAGLRVYARGKSDSALPKE